MRKSVFTGLVSLCSLLVLGVFNTAVAEYSVPVTHSHNGRTHNHQLPAIGIGHRHGIGQPGQAVRSQNKVIYSNTRVVPNNPSTTYKSPKPVTQSNNRVVNNDPNLHIHAGREHKHVLPNQGVFHRHGTSGAIGQRVVTNLPNRQSNPVVYEDIQRAPTINNTPGFFERNKNNNNGRVTNNEAARNDRQYSTRRAEKRRWNETSGLHRYVKGSTRCREGRDDCNFCAVNVQQQFQKAAAKQISWQRKRWNFTWPQPYPPNNVRPLDIFDGDPAYALGIPNKHVQGFVRTNSRLYPYAGSHSHKRRGGIFVVKQGANGTQTLSSLHQVKGKHPSGVQIIGRYLVYGVGSRLIFKDIESFNQTTNISLTAQGANFGGGLSIVKLARDNHLLMVTGPGGQKPGTRYNRFYHLKSVNGRPRSLRFINRSTTTKPSQWPNILNYSENMSAITECGTGDVYTVHTTGDQQGIGAIAGKGYWRLSKLVTNGSALGLKAVNAFAITQDIKRCNVRAAATVNVNPQNRLEFACHGYAKDPDGSGFNILGKSSRNRDKFNYNVGVVR